MKKILWFFIFFSVIFVLIILVNQQMIMHPQKRELQSYHFDWLDHSQKHGMKIEKYSSANNTPYLIVSLPQNYIKSKRQLLLKKQLKSNIKTVTKSVLVLLHGKNGRKEDLLPVAERYISLGFICILPDLPRHGDSQINTLYYATTPKEQSYVDEVLKDASQYIKARFYLQVQLFKFSLKDFIWGFKS